MKRHLLILLLFFCCTFSVYAADTRPCNGLPFLLQKACQRLRQVWYDGHGQIYGSGYAWHNRYTYRQDLLDKYNELAWGGGLGRGFTDEDGDLHTLYAIAFLDSHKNVEPMAGYEFEKMFRLKGELKLGLGYTLMVTMRPDILHGIPFPGVLPVVSFSYCHLTVFATYIPGTQNNGNVMFLLARWSFANI